MEMEIEGYEYEDISKRVRECLKDKNPYNSIMNYIITLKYFVYMSGVKDADRQIRKFIEGKFKGEKTVLSN